jgi:hypothetical protein
VSEDDGGGWRSGYVSREVGRQQVGPVATVPGSGKISDFKF